MHALAARAKTAEGSEAMGETLWLLVGRYSLDPTGA